MYSFVILSFKKKKKKVDLEMKVYNLIRNRIRRTESESDFVQKRKIKN